MGRRRSGSGEIVRTYPAGRGEEQLVFASAESRAVERRLGELADASPAVLFTGATGTGKTHLARALQRRAALPGLLQISGASATDSEVADLAARGLPALVASGGGSLLLDEVAELTPWSQAVLLASLERTEASSRGVRVIATTHRELPELVRDGRFSARLFALVADEVVALSPLRARRADIVPLALHHLRCALQRTGWDFIALDPVVLARLERHDWPGNARELKNTMEHALALAVDGDISTRELPEPLQRLAIGV